VNLPSTRYGDLGAFRQRGSGRALPGPVWSRWPAGELQQSIATFTRVIRKKPDFAEGWNKRATLYFLAGDLKKSLADCDEVMKRNPNHFGALSRLRADLCPAGALRASVRLFATRAALNPNLDGTRQIMELTGQLLEQRRRQSI